MGRGMTEPKRPMAEANRISTVLKMVLGPDVFPVKVGEVALEYSRQRFAHSPVAKVDGQDLAGFDGMLTANPSRSKWLILYNSAVRSAGRKRFTIAHEFGHYMLHTDQQDRFECSDADIDPRTHVCSERHPCLRRRTWWSLSKSSRFLMICG